MMMAALQMNVLSAEQEEERMLMQAIEESKFDSGVNDPTSPDVDNMTYEQLLEMGDNAGKVSRGLSAFQISKIKSFAWMEGRTNGNSCTICMDQFKGGQRFKRLSCNHEYHNDCVDQWLESSRKCPVCNKDVQV